jgi:hypothetical protein
VTSASSISTERKMITRTGSRGSMTGIGAAGAQAG